MIISNIKQIKVRLIFIALFGVFVLYLLLSASKNEIEVAKYKISNIRLDIPKAYHYGEYEKRSKWPKINSGVHQSEYITIDVILPNLDAVNEQNKHVFKQLGWGEKIRISLNSSPIYSFDRIISNYLNRNLLVESSYALKGLQTYKLKMVENGKPYKDFFVKKREGTIDFIGRCTLVTERSSPSCKVDRILKNGIHLQYIYSRNHIEQWGHIDRSILTLLNSFCSEKINCLTS